MRLGHTVTKEVDAEFDLNDVLEFIDEADEKELTQIKEHIYKDKTPPEENVFVSFRPPNLLARIEAEEWWENYKKKWFI